MQGFTKALKNNHCLPIWYWHFALGFGSDRIQLSLEHYRELFCDGNALALLLLDIFECGQNARRLKKKNSLNTMYFRVIGSAEKRS